MLPASRPCMRNIQGHAVLRWIRREPGLACGLAILLLLLTVALFPERFMIGSEINPTAFVR